MFGCLISFILGGCVGLLIGGCLAAAREEPKDGVDVVRCYKCNHMIEKGWCSLHSTPMSVNDFCSYGERGESDV